ncbi:MAG TPA: hypothetical protein VG248_02820 [Caulobacteraceae bacterium]|jgi:hypothetical protein|nr:hypothetical protein [Caulobacteraceae bacterium]
MNGLIRAIGLGVLRNVATAGGAWLIANHVIAQAQLNDFLGSVLFLGGVGFTLYDKFAVQKQVAVALATPTPPSA